MLLSNNASGNFVDADGILLVPNLGSEPGPANVKTEVATADVPIGTLDASTTNTVSPPKPQAAGHDESRHDRAGDGRDQRGERARPGSRGLQPGSHDE